MQEVVIMRGVSGSGKSTYAKEHFPDHTIVSADAFRYNDKGEYVFNAKTASEGHESCYRAFCEAMSRGESVVVDNTNTALSHFANYLEEARRLKASVRVVSLYCDTDKAAGRTVHETPRETILRQQVRFIEARSEIDGLGDVTHEVVVRP